MHNQSYNEQRQIFTVSEFNGHTKKIIENRFPLLWIEGELSNITRHGSGHWYFTLKDERAQLRCVMFRGQNQRTTAAFEHGQKVIVHARASFFEGRGDFQLIVEVMEDAGLGALQRAYQELHAKLLAEGLFEATLKKPLPSLPRRVAIITSPTGAAIHDMLTVFNTRCPLIEIVHAPAIVQGSEAPDSILMALEQVQQLSDIDAVIVGRGGGSLEDLWAFNDERVARAIAAYPLPVVSAVGHESDVTIADFVADARAATPSQAAELLSPATQQWQQWLIDVDQRLVHNMTSRIARLRQMTELQRRALKHPLSSINERGQRVDQLALRAQRAINNQTHQLKHQLSAFEKRLQAKNPQREVGQQQLRLSQLMSRLQGPATEMTRIPAQELEQLVRRLDTATESQVANRHRAFQLLAAKLHGVSPLATLDRGYTLVTHNGAIVSTSKDLNRHDEIEIKWHDGHRRAQIQD